MSIVCHLVSINPRESIAVSGDFCMFTFSGRGLARLCLIADYIYNTWQFVHLSDKRGMSLQASWRVASSSPIILGFEILPIGITATHCGFGINGLFGEQLSLFTLCEASSLCVCVCVHRKDSFLAFFQKTFFADQLTLSALHIRTFPLSTFFSQHFQSTNGRKGKFLILCKHWRFSQEIGHECSEPSLPSSRIKTWRCPHCDSLRRSMI